MQTKNRRTRSTVKGAQKPQADFRPCPAQELREYEIEDDLVLYNPSKDVAHILNLTAAVVWWLCDGNRTLDDIAVRVADLYGKETTDVLHDARTILSNFRAVGLVVES